MLCKSRTKQPITTFIQRITLEFVSLVACSLRWGLMQYQLSPNGDPLPIGNFTDTLVICKFVQKLPSLYKLYLHCFIVFYRWFMNTWSVLGEQSGKRTLD